MILEAQNFKQAVRHARGVHGSFFNLCIFRFHGLGRLVGPLDSKVYFTLFLSTQVYKCYRRQNVGPGSPAMD